MRFAQSVVMLAVLSFALLIFINLALDAAIKEQEFADNLRFSRCEKMDAVELKKMRAYCKDFF